MVTPFGVSHIVLFSRDVHVWVYLTSNFWKIFTIFLYIILKYNLDKKLEKKLFHFIL
jgi:hypothetical protein